MAVATMVFAAVAGLLLGSFLTVVVDRVPEGRSVVAPGSACGQCGLRLGPLDLIPVISWIVLRGRCRRCRTSIGIEPLVLELATCGIFVLVASKFGARWATAAFCVLAAGLVALSWIDLHHRRLPREISYVTLAVGAPLLVVDALVRSEPHRITTMLLGAACALVFMAALYFLSNGGMGDGDVRLSPLLGAFLGWLSMWHVAVGLFLGFVFGAVVGVVAMVVGRAGRKTAIPFGPFLAAGTLTAILVGDRLIDAMLWR